MKLTLANVCLFIGLHFTVSTLAADPTPTGLTRESVQWKEGARVLVVGGGSSHDFQKWFNKADLPIIQAAGKYAAYYTEDVGSATKELPGVDVLVSSTNKRGFDTPEFRAALFAFADSGKGIVLLHPGLWYNWPWPEYNKVLAGGGARSHDALGPFEVKVLKEHPVTKGLPPTFKVIDELYQVRQDPSGAPIDVLAQTSTSLPPGKNTRACGL